MLNSKTSVLTAFLLLNTAVSQNAFGQAIPPEVSGAADQWPLPNRDYANTRAIFDTRISSANVHLLNEAWSFELPAPPSVIFGNAAANPVILGDTVYFQDLQTNVFAIDLSNGSEKWQHETGIGNFGPTGVAVGWGKVFAVQGEKSMMALDRETGAEMWSVNLSRTRGEGITIHPVPYDGNIYMSTVPVTIAGALEGLNGYIPGATGIVHALDEENGTSQWSFDTVDSPDIWGNPEENSGGGAWYPPAIDVNDGTTFWGTGNPAPWPGTQEFPNGTSRPGDNLYTNSVVALDHQTGNLDWYHQVNPHDLFDKDFQSSPILATVNFDGQDRDIVIGAGKVGRVVALDRATGELLWDTPVGVHENDSLTEVPPGESVLVTPGALGGVLTPMAYADGTVFAPVSNHPTLFTATSSETLFDYTDSTGNLVALNAVDGSVKWDVVFDSLVLGGATVVNDLVFTSTIDGMIYALDRDNGDEVWSYQLPGGTNAWPAVSGETIVFPMGFPSAGNTAQIIALRIPEPNSLVLLIVITITACGFMVLNRRVRRRDISRWELA